MIKTIEDRIDIYRPERVYWEKSLEYAKSLKPQTLELPKFHCFWRVPKDLTGKHVAVLKSIIVNNPKGTEINFWSNIDLSKNSLLSDISPYIQFRIWNVYEESKGTILENSKILNNISDSLCYLEGDLFRLLVLHKYGGFYIDMDVLVLRDMSPINHLEFLYQWGTTGFNINEPTFHMNGAVMRLEKNSPLSLEFLEKILENPGRGGSTDWGTVLYSKINKNDLLVLPCMWFNSEWGYAEADNIPFKKANQWFNLFDGAFAWHWHNRWDEEIEDGSKFQILESIHNKKFQNLIFKAVI